MHKWEKNVALIALFIFVGLILLGNDIFKNDPAAKQLEFVFIFFAYIALFPLIISQQKPRLNRWAYQYNRRAPPLS